MSNTTFNLLVMGIYCGLPFLVFLLMVYLWAGALFKVARGSKKRSRRRSASSLPAGSYPHAGKPAIRPDFNPDYPPADMTYDESVSAWEHSDD